MYGFGSGLLYAVRTDITNPTPRRFGAIQDIQIDLSGDLKELFGQSQFPLDVARGKIKITGKAKFASISVLDFNDAFFGQTSSTGTTKAVYQEAHAVPASVAYTFTAANATGFSDLGCRYAATGLPLTVVPSAPTQGQYTVTSSGVYTFAAADASANMLIDYTYTVTGSGLTLPITNQLMGSGPVFRSVMSQSYKQQTWTLTLNACMSSKMSLPTKIDDYVINEMDFQAYADAAGNIGSFTTTDVSG